MAFFLMTVIALFIVACRPHRYPSQLLLADSLCMERPDSAIALLRQLTPQMADASKADRMYYNLLRIKSADKADHSITQFDSLALHLIYYYEDGGDPAKLAEAYYYAGRVWFAKQDAPQALDYYLKAMEIVNEKHVAEMLESVLYSQCGYIFMYQGMYDEGQRMFEKAYRTDSLNNDTLGMVYGLRDISTAMEAKDDHVSALNTLKVAYCLVKKTRNRYLTLNVESYLATQYRMMNQLDSAMFFIKSPLENVELMDSSAVYSNAARLYHAKGNVDSTMYYCMLLTKIGDVYAKESAYRIMTDVWMKKGNLKESNVNYQHWQIYLDSVKMITQTATIARINSLYNLNKKEKENQVLRREKQNRTTFIIVILFMLATLLIYLYYYRKSQKEKSLRFLRSEQLKEESLRKSSLEIDKNNQRIKELEIQLKDVGEENTVLCVRLEREKERLLSSNIVAQVGINEKGKALVAVKDSAVYRRFQTASYDDDIHLNERDWMELESLLNNEYSQFCAKIKSLCNLTKMEYRVTLLVKLCIEPNQIANIMNCSRSNVSTIRSRLYMKVFGRKGKSTDWDDFINTL